jgi:thiamine pyrophosphokinase
MSVLIFANGVIEEVEWIRPYVVEAAAVIAADGGGRHLLRLGVRPDVVIGDLDSLDKSLYVDWAAAGTTIAVVSVEKDETDLELALLYAVDHYPDEIKIFGALGGRLDQTLANILLLAHPTFSNRRIELVEPGQRAWLIQKQVEIIGPPRKLVSLIPLGGDVQISRTTGLKWKLEDEVLDFGPARGISNVMIEDKAIVEVNAGTLLCVVTDLKEVE